MTISENWAQLLEPGLREIFFTSFGTLAAESRLPMLFRMMVSGKAAEHFLGAGGFSDWEVYGGNIDYDENDQGYKTTLTAVEYVRGFPVERKLVDDDLYNIINDRPAGLAMAAQRTREKHAASVFNNAFSNSFSGGDLVSLCNDSHPYSPSNATVQDNAGDSALTYANVVTTRRLMREYKDDRGELTPINPDLLLVPAELDETASRIVNTMNGSALQIPDQVNFADNFVARIGMKVIVWDYLTDANNWFVLDSALAKRFLLWIDRTALEFALDPTSDFNLVSRWRGYMRYSYGWSDWKWVFGHAVS